MTVSEHEPIENTQILIELYRAMNALDRVDQFANVFYGSDQKACDGLIAQTDFINDPVQSKRIEKRAGIHANANEYINLLFGLVITHHYLPKSTIVQGLDLKEKAKEQSLRLINYLEKNAWKIKVPGQGKSVNVYGDYNLKPYSYLLKEIRLSLTDTNGRRIKGVNSVFKSIANLFRKNSRQLNHDGKMALLNALAFSKRSKKKVINQSEKEGWLVYPMVHALLNKTEPSAELDSLILKSETLLNEVPVSGIYSSFDEGKTHGWTTRNYFRNTEKARLSESNSTEKVRFNGLDFLLFYNIWFIHRTGI